VPITALGSSRACDAVGILVVDGNNVIGAVANGWWRDRRRQYGVCWPGCSPSTNRPRLFSTCTARPVRRRPRRDRDSAMQPGVDATPLMT
jgi:hypothetical protein